MHAPSVASTNLQQCRSGPRPTPRINVLDLNWVRERESERVMWAQSVGPGTTNSPHSLSQCGIIHDHAGPLAGDGRGVLKLPRVEVNVIVWLRNFDASPKTKKETIGGCSTRLPRFALCFLQFCHCRDGCYKGTSPGARPKVSICLCFPEWEHLNMKTEFILNSQFLGCCALNMTPLLPVKALCRIHQQQIPHSESK